MGQAIVRLLQGHDTETSNVIRSFELVCRAGSERGTSHAHFTHFLDHMGKDVFDRPHWGSGEFQSPLDLEAVCGSKLSKDNQRANLQRGEIRSDVEYEWPTYRALGILCIKVLPVLRIIEGSQPSQMNLGSLPMRFPVRQAFVDQLLSLLVNLTIDFDSLYTLPFCAMNLPPHGFFWLNLGGVKPLFCDGADGAPPQLMCQDSLARFVHARPDGLEFFLILDVMKERSDHLRHLFGIA